MEPASTNENGSSNTARPIAAATIFVSLLPVHVFIQPEITGDRVN